MKSFTQNAGTIRGPATFFDELPFFNCLEDFSSQHQREISKLSAIMALTGNTLPLHIELDEWLRQEHFNCALRNRVTEQGHLDRLFSWYIQTVPHLNDWEIPYGYGHPDRVYEPDEIERWRTAIKELKIYHEVHFRRMGCTREATGILYVAMDYAIDYFAFPNHMRIREQDYLSWPVGFFPQKEDSIHYPPPPDPRDFLDELDDSEYSSSSDDSDSELSDRYFYSQEDWDCMLVLHRERYPLHHSDDDQPDHFQAVRFRRTNMNNRAERAARVNEFPVGNGVVHRMMIQQGWEGNGLGARQQGMINPVREHGQHDRRGFGSRVTNTQVREAAGYRRETHHVPHPVNPAAHAADIEGASEGLEQKNPPEASEGSMPNMINPAKDVIKAGFDVYNTVQNLRADSKGETKYQMYGGEKHPQGRPMGLSTMNANDRAAQSRLDAESGASGLANDALNIAGDAAAIFMSADTPDAVILDENPEDSAIAESTITIQNTNPPAWDYASRAARKFLLQTTTWQATGIDLVTIPVVDAFSNRAVRDILTQFRYVKWQSVTFTILYETNGFYQGMGRLIFCPGNTQSATSRPLFLRTGLGQEFYANENTELELVIPYTFPTPLIETKQILESDPKLSLFGSLFLTELAPFIAPTNLVQSLNLQIQTSIEGLEVSVPTTYITPPPTDDDDRPDHFQMNSPEDIFYYPTTNKMQGRYSTTRLAGAYSDRSPINTDTSVSYLTSIWSLIKKVKWTVGTSGELTGLRWIARVEDFLGMDVTNTETSIINYLGMFATNWSGTFELKVQVSRSAYHQGKLLFCWVPAEVGNISASAATQYPYVVVDINTSNEFCFKIPNTHIRPLRYVNVKPSGPKFADALGSIRVFTFSPLIATTNVSSAIDILVWVRGSQEADTALRFYNPSNVTQYKRTDNAPSFQADNACITICEDTATGPIPFGYEEIIDLTQLTSRVSPVIVKSAKYGIGDAQNFPPIGLSGYLNFSSYGTHVTRYPNLYAPLVASMYTYWYGDVDVMIQSDADVLIARQMPTPVDPDIGGNMAFGSGPGMVRFQLPTTMITAKLSPYGVMNFYVLPCEVDGVFDAKASDEFYTPSCMIIDSYHSSDLKSAQKALIYYSTSAGFSYLGYKYCPLVKAIRDIVYDADVAAGELFKNPGPGAPLTVNVASLPPIPPPENLEVSVNNFPPSGPITGTVAVNNFPTSTYVTGSVDIANAVQVYSTDNNPVRILASTAQKSLNPDDLLRVSLTSITHNHGLGNVNTERIPDIGGLTGTLPVHNVDAPRVERENPAYESANQTFEALAQRNAGFLERFKRLAVPVATRPLSPIPEDDDDVPDHFQSDDASRSPPSRGSTPTRTPTPGSTGSFEVVSPPESDDDDPDIARIRELLNYAERLPNEEAELAALERRVTQRSNGPSLLRRILNYPSRVMTTLENINHSTNRVTTAVTRSAISFESASSDIAGFIRSFTSISPGDTALAGVLVLDFFETLYEHRLAKWGTFIMKLSLALSIRTGALLHVFEQIKAYFNPPHQPTEGNGMQFQAGGEPHQIGMMLSVVVMAIGLKSSGAMENKKKLSMWEHLAQRGREMHNMKMGVTAFMEGYQAIYETVMECLIKYVYNDDPELKDTYLKSSIAQELVSISEVIREMHEYDYVRFISYQPERRELFKKTYNRINDLRHRITKANNRDLNIQFLTMKSTIDDLISSAMTNSPDFAVRLDPPHYYFYGSPGAGKSAISAAIARAILESQHLPVKGNIYCRTEASSFHDNYNHQYVYQIDDGGMVADPERAMECIQRKSNVPMVLEMADLKKKGMYFTSKCIMTTSNQAYPEEPGIKNREALLRRRDVLIECVPIRDARGRKRPYSHDFNHLRFNIRDPLDYARMKNPTMAGLDFPTLLNYLIIKHGELLSKQVRFVKGIQPEIPVDKVYVYDGSLECAGKLRQIHDKIVEDMRKGLEEADENIILVRDEEPAQFNMDNPDAPNDPRAGGLGEVDIPGDSSEYDSESDENSHADSTDGYDSIPELDDIEEMAMEAINEELLGPIERVQAEERYEQLGVLNADLIPIDPERPNGGFIRRMEHETQEEFEQRRQFIYQRVLEFRQRAERIIRNDPRAPPPVLQERFLLGQRLRVRMRRLAVQVFRVVYTALNNIPFMSPMARAWARIILSLTDEVYDIYEDAQAVYTPQAQNVDDYVHPINAEDEETIIQVSHFTHVGLTIIAGNVVAYGRTEAGLNQVFADIADPMALCIVAEIARHHDESEAEIRAYFGKRYHPLARFIQALKTMKPRYVMTELANVVRCLGIRSFNFLVEVTTSETFREINSLPTRTATDQFLTEVHRSTLNMEVFNLMSLSPSERFVYSFLRFCVVGGLDATFMMIGLKNTLIAFATLAVRKAMDYLNRYIPYVNYIVPALFAGFCLYKLRTMYRNDVEEEFKIAVGSGEVRKQMKMKNLMFEEDTLRIQTHEHADLPDDGVAYSHVHLCEKCNMAFTHMHKKNPMETSMRYQNLCHRCYTKKMRVATALLLHGPCNMDIEVPVREGVDIEELEKEQEPVVKEDAPDQLESVTQNSAPKVKNNVIRLESVTQNSAPKVKNNIIRLEEEGMRPKTAADVEKLIAEKAKGLCFQGTNDQNAVDVGGKIFPNQGTIWRGNRSLKYIGIYGRCVVVPGHIMQPIQSVYNLTLSRMGVNYDVVLLDKFVIRSKLSDNEYDEFVVLDLTDCPQIPTFADIRSHFIQEKEVGLISGSQVMLQIKSDLATRDRSFAKTCDLVGKVILPTETTFSGFATGVRYDIATKLGDCGSPLIVLNPQITGKIVGMHVIGNSKQNKGWSCLITRERLEKLEMTFQCANAPPFDFLVDSFDNLEDHELPSYTPPGKHLILGKLKTRMIPSPLKSDIIPSPIYDKAFKHTTEPVILSMKDPRNTSGDPPMIKAVKKFNSTAGGWDYFDRVICREHSLKQFVELTRDYGGPRRLLSIDEAINGIPGWVEPLNMRTSPGYPFILARPSGEIGKSGFFTVIGTSDKGAPIYSPKPDLMATINEYLEIAKTEMWCKNNYYVDWLKDERRKIEKVRSANTRMFNIHNMAWLIIMRVYYGSVLAAYTFAGIKNGSTIGINMHGPDVTELIRHLSSAGTNWWDLDVSNFDGTADNECIHDALYVFKGWLRFQIPVDHVLDVVGESIFWRIHVLGILAYVPFIGVPSGWLLTAIIDTEINKQRRKLSWRHLMKLYNKREYLSLDVKEKLARETGNGDDILGAVNDAVKHIFNPENISAHWKDHGVLGTPPTKEAGGVVGGFREWNHVTYLKCHFARHEDYQSYYVARMSIDTILELSNWIRTSSCDMVMLRSNLTDMERFLYTHGRAKYNSTLCEIQRAMRDIGEHYIPTPYDYYDDLWRNEHGIA